MGAPIHGPAVILLRALLAILLVYVPNQLHFPSDLGLKGLNVFNLLLLLTWILMLVNGAGAGKPAPLRWRIAAFCGMLVLAFFVGQRHLAAVFMEDLTELKTALSYILLYFLFYHAVDSVKTIRMLFLVLLFVVFIASLEVIREALDYGIGNYVFTHRASGPFGHDWRNANRAGVFFAMFGPLFVSLMLFYKERGWVRWLALLGIGCATAAAFFTYSRQSYIILALGALILAVRRNPLIGVVVALFLSTYTLWAPATVVERMQSTYVEDATGEEQLEESAESRLIIWKGAFQMIKRHPFGVGFNRFKGEIGNYTIYEAKDAHNEYVLIASEAGLQGLLAFLLVVFGLLGLGIRLWRIADTEEEKVLGYGFTVVCLCTILGNVYGSPFFYGEVTGNLWALAGLVARYTDLVQNAEEEEEPVAEQAVLAEARA